MKVFKGLGKNVSEAKNDYAKILAEMPELDFQPYLGATGYLSPLHSQWTTDKGKFRIFNGNTGKPIDGGHMVTKNYKTHPIREVVQSLCEISDKSGLTLSDIAIIRGGEHILLRAESGKAFSPVVGDIYGGSVLFKISNVPGIVSSCSAYVLRLVCLNGATAKEDLGSGVMKLHHRRDYDSAAREEVEKLSQSLEVALKSYEEKMEILYNAQFDVGYSKYFSRLMELAEDVVMPRSFDSWLECCETQPGGTSTFGTWAHLYNATTYWVDHVRGRKPESSLFSTIYGDGARLKRKALHLALEMIKGV